MATVKVSDAMWRSAEAVVDYAAKMGITLRISDVYNKETANTLALIVAQMNSIITSTGNTVEVEKD